MSVRELGVWLGARQVAILRAPRTGRFTVAIGNADAHGKNVSLLHNEPGTVALAPLYDTVLWPKLRTTAAMTVDGKADLRRITLDDIVAEAQSWRIEPRHARVRAVATAERMLDVLDADAVQVDTPAMDLTAVRLEALLRR